MISLKIEEGTVVAFRDLEGYGFIGAQPKDVFFHIQNSFMLGIKNGQVHFTYRPTPESARRKLPVRGDKIIYQLAQGSQGPFAPRWALLNEAVGLEQEAAANPGLTTEPPYQGIHHGEITKILDVDRGFVRSNAGFDALLHLKHCRMIEVRSGGLAFIPWPASSKPHNPFRLHDKVIFTVTDCGRGPLVLEWAYDPDS